MWVRAAMFATIMVLMALILVTPTLLGHPSELTAIPALIVAMTPDHGTIIVDVTAAAQAYLYKNITLTVSHMNVSANYTNVTVESYARNNSYNAALYVPANATPLWIHTRLIDQQNNFFEYNLTVSRFNDPNNAGQLTLVFNFPDEPGTATRYMVPPSDFRWAVPRRGMFP